MLNITKKLIALKDDKNAKFLAKLTPNIKPETILGIKNPVTRKLAKEYFKEEEHIKFMNTLPHKYFDEYMLHAMLINEIKDYKEAIKEINKLLPYVNSWPVSDAISPKKAFRKNINLLKKEINKWIRSSKTFTVRFGLAMIIAYCLDEEFEKEMLIYPSTINTDEYYINMALAWLFSFALIKQYDSTINYIKDKKLNKWVHNKSIQKAIESYRIDEKTKEYLRSLKVK